MLLPYHQNMNLNVHLFKADAGSAPVMSWREKEEEKPKVSLETLILMADDL